MALRQRLLTFLRDVLCGFVAYIGARWIWGPPEGAFTSIHKELLTFALLWLLLQLLIRGWRLSRKGKKPA